ncbi:hypothetical protein P5673_023095 [Acropora cervicornis]|uniref:Uncharacterized protein n=1 Tax=Acropora cervicornis TaxID=6130 RepID=A0AAD9UZB6_ACRCE|nr:hypothetical protein P5673_023095 [Acropora cervicornis]
MASDLLNLATAKTGRFKIYLKIYSGYLERMQTEMNPQEPLKTASQLCTKVTSFLQNNPTAPNGIHFREFVNHGGWETYLSSMSMDGRWHDPTALHGMVNILCISAAVVSFSLREEEADFHSIALLAHEDKSHFHSLQQMAAKTIAVVEELQLKCAEGCLPE